VERGLGGFAARGAAEEITGTLLDLQNQSPKKLAEWNPTSRKEREKWCTPVWALRA
jgi:hypothetical protein